MTDPGQVMATLDSYAREMDDLSRKLADVERRFEPVEARYEAFLDAHSVGLWEAHQDGQKLPGEDLRLRLARRDMPADLLGEYSSLLHSRKRLERRISALAKAISAQQSILSALKMEMEAVR